jgi:hypothetical protein
MKKYVFPILMVAILVSSYSCKKDEKLDPVTPALSCLIDGVLWDASEIGLFEDQSDSLVEIVCNDTSNDQVLKLSFICTGTGTVTFMKNNYDNFGSFMIYFSAPGVFSSNFSINPTGQIVITEYNQTRKTISGTFHFDAHDKQGNKKSFTEGKFTDMYIWIL